MVFDSLIARFRAADRSTRLETLLEYAKKLPDLPPALQAASDREAHRVSECQTCFPLIVTVSNECSLPVMNSSSSAGRCSPKPAM